MMNLKLMVTTVETYLIPSYLMQNFKYKTTILRINTKNY
jgi:hypothetical protein